MKELLVVVLALLMPPAWAHSIAGPTVPEKSPAPGTEETEGVLRRERDSRGDSTWIIDTSAGAYRLAFSDGAWRGAAAPAWIGCTVVVRHRPGHFAVGPTKFLLVQSVVLKAPPRKGR